MDLPFLIRIDSKEASEDVVAIETMEAIKAKQDKEPEEALEAMAT